MAVQLAAGEVDHDRAAAGEAEAHGAADDVVVLQVDAAAGKGPIAPPLLATVVSAITSRVLASMRPALVRVSPLVETTMPPAPEASITAPGGVVQGQAG